MEKSRLLSEINASKEYFDRSTRCLKEEHSAHAPASDMYTVAAQVAHVAFSIDWFVDGATKPEGFDMNFEEHDRHAKSVKSLAAARKKLDTAFARLSKFVESNTQAYLDAPMTAGPLMIGEPRFTIVTGCVEHTAHHRGALTVYSRTLGLVPVMPYMEPQPA
jgi:uncharacterized damage-inducible protein DinB